MIDNSIASWWTDWTLVGPSYSWTGHHLGIFFWISIFVHQCLIKNEENRVVFEKVSSDPPKKQQHNNTEKDEAQPNNSWPENPLSAERTSESSSNTVKARAQHFHPEWKRTFPWVYYADEKMFCHTCWECPQKSNDSSSLVNGCSNFRIESLKSHARSTEHVQTEEAISAKEMPMEAPLPRVHLFLYQKRWDRKWKKCLMLLTW